MTGDWREDGQAAANDVLQQSRIERGPGRPKSYQTLAGVKVPGVTSVCSRFKDSGALIGWAYKQGKEGKDLYDRTAMDIGTLVHSLVEADIHDKPHPPIPPAFESAVVSAYSAWRDWRASSQLEIVATEVPLVSERWHYGGTIDCVARFPTVGLTILDWKSANSIYTDNLLQLAAYGELWREHRDQISGYYIARFSKEHGDFSAHYFSDLTDALEEFLLLRHAYDIDKKLQTRVK